MTETNKWRTLSNCLFIVFAFSLHNLVSCFHLTIFPFYILLFCLYICSCFFLSPSKFLSHIFSDLHLYFSIIENSNHMYMFLYHCYLIIINVSVCEYIFSRQNSETCRLIFHSKHRS
uniref:Uncharacterized protein n=1 Tax=Octopus bimaculoides TaxID=37653 RepID=A0A0L8IDD0_OCTBM